MIGQVFLARYLIEQRIGSGGMSDVYRGLDLNTERRVAVKILKEEFASDDEFLRRFQREAQAAAALSHENIVAVYDLGHEDGIDFIVMEYVHGDTLKEKIQKQGALPMEDVLRYGIELCSAIEHAHAAHIIHRDIKPQNVIISDQGTVKLADFGIARATTSMTLTMTDGSVMGSVHYFSPEQARGDVAAEPSDLYSLGVVLFEMATGRVPFSGDSPVMLALRHLQEPPMDPVTLNPLVSPALSKIILKALRKDIRDRYQSAAEMMADLRRVATEPEGDYVCERVVNPNDLTRRVPVVKLPVEAEPSDFALEESQTFEEEPIDRRGRKKRFPVGAVLALTAIALACAGLIWLGARGVAFLMEEPAPLVPKVTGEAVDRAQEILREYEYISSVERAFSDEIAVGLVISQSPEAETPLEKGSLVGVLVSLGPEFIPVPRLVGTPRDLAAETLKSAFLTAHIELLADSDRPRGEVVRQDPEDGVSAKNGSTVILYVSDPPLMRRVPNLSGKQLAEAMSDIINSGLELGETREQVTTEVEPGWVVRQSPEANTEAIEGSGVDIYLSVAPEQLFVKTVDIQLALLEGEHFISVDIQDEAGKVRSLFSKTTMIDKENLFEQTLELEERAGTYTIAVYVDSIWYESRIVVFGEE